MSDVFVDWANTEPTQEELKTLTCAWCGKVAKSEAGLKTHKTAEAKKHGFFKTEKKMLKQTALEVPKQSDGKLNCLELGINEIVEGSRIGLKGQHFIVDDQNQLHSEFADDVIVNVVLRWKDPASNKFYLKSRAVGGSKHWVCSEEDVLLTKNAYLIALKPPEVPSNYVPDIPISIEREEKDDQEDLKEQEAYKEALQAYVDARNIKLVAVKKFEEVKKQYEAILRAYVAKNGIDWESGKRLAYDGYTVILQSSDEVSYNEDQIIEFLKEHNLVFALKPTVDFEAWKVLKENGKVPEEIVEKVEGKSSKDKLLIEKSDVDA